MLRLDNKKHKKVKQMKKQSVSFPSVYEAVGTDLNFVSKSLVNGLQLYDAQEQSYIIGDLALTEGISPNKLVNSSPHEIDYQLLLNAGILLANHENNRPLAVTTGFPFSTYQVYKDIAKEMIEGLNTIEYNPGTYSNAEKTKINANIKQVEILPEMIGNIIALRVGETQAEGNFFVVSLGYGTCEAVLSTESGIVHRTSLSINGMQYAVDLFMRSLATKYYLGLKTEKQLDVSFRNDHIILDRQKVNIVDLRKRILERYYKDIISAGLRKSFTDSDFERADRIFLTGGGAMFPELIEQFEKEFKQIAKVEVVKNPLTLTSEGYSLNSIMLTNGDKSTAIGLDVGNANTVLTQYVDESVADTPETVEKIEVKTEVKEPVVEEKKEEPEKKEEKPEVEEKKEKEKIEEAPEVKTEVEKEKVETKVEEKTTPEVEEKQEKKEVKEKKPERKKIIETNIEEKIEEEIKVEEKVEEETIIEEEEPLTIPKVEEEIKDEEEEEEDYEEKLVELSTEEKEILSKEVGHSVDKKEEVEDDEKNAEKEEEIKSKGNLENYEPDFS
jgi:hypothetical protein